MAEPARCGDRPRGELLRDARLRLHEFTEQDRDRLVELDSDPMVMRYLTGGRTTPGVRHHDEHQRRFPAGEGAGRAAFVQTFHLDWPEPIERSELGDVEYALERRDWKRNRGVR